MQLQIGDRFIDATGEWEVVGRPYTTNSGKNAHVRVQRVNQPGVTEIPDVGSVREGQRETSMNRVGAMIPPWRGVPDATSADRKRRLPDRFMGNSPCSRRAILGTPSQPTRPIRAG